MLVGVCVYGCTLSRMRAPGQKGLYCLVQHCGPTPGTVLANQWVFNNYESRKGGRKAKREGGRGALGASLSSRGIYYVTLGKSHLLLGHLLDVLNLTSCLTEV